MRCIPQESRGRHRRKHDLRCPAVHPATRTSTLRLNIIRHLLHVVWSGKALRHVSAVKHSYVATKAFEIENLGSLYELHAKAQGGTP